MFKSNTKGKNMASPVNVNDVSRIAAGTSVTGDLTSLQDMRIDGRFEGRLYCEGRLVVGEKGVVKGDVIGQNVDFGGTMESGNFYVKDTLALKAGCRIEGDIYYRRLEVELEARFVGKSQVLSEEEYNKMAAPMQALLHKDPEKKEQNTKK